MSIYCESCHQMVDTMYVHSCFDAALHVRLNEAERAVIAAALALTELHDLHTVTGGVVMPHTMSLHLKVMDAQRALLINTRALRSLGGGA